MLSMYILYTTQHDNIVVAFNCVFEVIQDPARCRMLLQQITDYYCNTTSAAPGGARWREPRTTAPRRGEPL